MALLKFCMRFVAGFFRSFLAFVVFYLLCSFWLPFFHTGTFATAPGGITLFIESNGVHTDFVLPAKSPPIRWFDIFPATDFERVDTSFKWVAIGWGDKGFYLDTKTWGDLKWTTAFRAAFGLSTTALHVGYKRYTPQCDGYCTRLEISREQYAKLILYILQSLNVRNGPIQHIDHAGYGDADTFYEAGGTYSLFKTCNVWTCGGLHAMHQRCALWSPFERGVMESLK